MPSRYRSKQSLHIILYKNVFSILHLSLLVSSPLSDANGHIESSMWVDKYKPSRLEDVIGCQDIVKKLLDWIARSVQ